LNDVVWIPKVCTSLACAVRWLDGWQTLIGAAIAIPVAALAIAVSLSHEKRRQEAKLAAVRATMPLRLSTVSNYAEAAIRALAAVRRPGSIIPIGDFARPAIPNGLADGLERTIEAIHNKRVVDRLSNMIGEMQVLDSRMSGLGPNNEIGANLDVYLVQAATIRAQSDSLYDFARRLSSTTERRLSWGKIKSSLMAGRAYDATHPDVYAYIVRLSARKTHPEENEVDSSLLIRFRTGFIAVCKKLSGWWNTNRQAEDNE
jgi:hypothetical protein